MKRSKQFKQITDHTTQLYDRVTKIETQILDKISVMKKLKNKTNYICEHLIQDEQCEQYDNKIDYYDLFWKMYLLNQLKRTKIQQFESQVQTLKNDYEWLEKKFQKYDKLVSYRNDVNSHSIYHELNRLDNNQDGGNYNSNDRYQCKIHGCGKTYQSLGALDLHHKIKHQSQRSQSNQVGISEQDSILINIKNNNNNNSNNNNRRSHYQHQHQHGGNYNNRRNYRH